MFRFFFKYFQSVVGRISFKQQYYMVDNIVVTVSNRQSHTFQTISGSIYLSYRNVLMVKEEREQKKKNFFLIYLIWFKFLKYFSKYLKKASSNTMSINQYNKFQLVYGSINIWLYLSKLQGNVLMVKGKREFFQYI